MERSVSFEPGRARVGYHRDKMILRGEAYYRSGGEDGGWHNVPASFRIELQGSMKEKDIFSEKDIFYFSALYTVNS